MPCVKGSQLDMLNLHSHHEDWEPKLVQSFFAQFSRLELKHTWGVHHIRSYLPISTLQEALLKLTRSNEMMACAAEEIFYLIKQKLKILLRISPAKRVDLC